jgi:hypothetical protein
MVAQLLANGEALGSAGERRVQLTHEVQVDALPAQGLAQPPALRGRLQMLDRAPPVLQALREP